MVIVASRAAPLLASTLTVTFLVPLPLVGDTVIQELAFAGTDVVQLHSAWLAVTVTG